MHFLFIIILQIFFVFSSFTLYSLDIDYSIDYSETDLKQRKIHASPMKANGSDQDQEPFQFALSAECEPLTTVAGCVNVLSGHFFQIEQDFLGNTIEPLSICRYYDSGNNSESMFGYGFGSQFPLWASAIQEGTRHNYSMISEREGFLLPYKASLDSYRLEVDPRVLEKGYTNLNRTAMSGAANFVNWKATFGITQEYPAGHWIVQLGDGTKRIYNKAVKISTEEKRRLSFPMKTGFLLTEEIKPNGNSLQFSYQEIHGKNRLTEIKTINRKSVVLNSIKFHYSPGKCTLTTSTNEEINYLYNEMSCISHHIDSSSEAERKVLTSLDSTQHGLITYETKKDKGNRKISKILKPDGRSLEVEYIEATHRSEEDRVKKIIEPLGEKGKSVPTYQFQYEKDHTIFKDALGRNKNYYFDKNQRLVEIRYFDENKQLSRSDLFEWSKKKGQEGWLRSKAIVEGGLIYYLKTYRYDERGNIIRITIYGNVLGGEVNGFTQKEIPNMDRHITEYAYNSANLITEKITPEEKISSEYLPETNLCIKVLHQYDGKIQKRIFTEYDDNGQVISLIEDDGSNSAVDDFSDVQVRLIKKIETIEDINHPAFGKPCKIKESYWDKLKRKEILLKTIGITYDARGSEEKRSHSNSKGLLCYETKTKYNKEHLLEEETNSLGELTRYRYDDNHNKIEEETVGSGKITTFNYDLGNRLISKIEKSKQGDFETKFTYNRLHQLISVTDPYGQITFYKYDELGNQVECIKPVIETYDGGKITPTIKKTYNCLSQLISETDENNFTTQYKYNLFGSPIKITYPDKSEKKLIYNLNGKLKEMKLPNGTSIHYTYDGGGHLINEETHDLEGNLLKGEAYTYKGSLVHSYTDPVGIITTFSYDEAGRKVEEKIGDLKTIKYSYDDFGRLVKTEQNNRQEILGYDWLNRVTSKVSQESEKNHFKKETFEYDIQGNQIKHTVWISKDESAVYHSNYNEDGTVDWKENPLLHRTTFKYDHKFKNLHGKKVLKRNIFDPMNQVLEETEDIYHRIESREHYAGKIKFSNSHYYYDPVGNLTDETSQVMSDGVILRQYSVHRNFDHRGLVTSEIELPGNKTTTYLYDKMGRLEEKIKPDGISLKYSYDPLGRIKSLISSDKSVHYIYTHDLKDNLIKIEDRIHKRTQNRLFDSYGRLEEEQLNQQSIIKYTYDSFDRPLKITLPDCSTVVYDYDSYRLNKIQRHESSGKLNYEIKCLSYDWQGHLLESQSPAGKISYIYDKLGRQTAIKTPLWESNYDEFDFLGNLIKLSGKNPSGKISEQFAYDRFNHLTSESAAKFEYDSLGNCLKKNNISQTTNTSNQLINNNTSTFTYDLNGNLTAQSNPPINYTYDALDRLIAIDQEGNRTTLLYDALNRCLEITNSQGTKKLLYQGNQEIGSQLNENINEFRLIHPEQEITFVIELEKEKFFPIQDHRGNICALQKADGSIPQWVRYSAFGENNVEGAAAIQNPWLFNNRREVCGLTLFTHRFYNPTLMRWQTPDPLGFEDGLNLYTYVRNNPHYYKDPDGRFVFLIPIFIGVFGPSGIVITGATVGAIAGTVAGTVLGVATYKAIQAADHKYDQVERENEEDREGKKRPSKRTDPRNLEEQLALEEARANPGKELEKLHIKDPSYPKGDWAKKQYIHQGLGSNDINIHYWENRNSGERHDFKFKDN